MLTDSEKITILREALTDLIRINRSLRHSFEQGNWPKDTRMNAWNDAIVHSQEALTEAAE
jgi:hypothetical protein